MEKEGRKIPSPSLRIGIVCNLGLNHGITHWDQKSGEITSASPSQVTPSPALLAMRIGVDRQREVLAEGIETGALEQPVVAVVNWGIAPAALGVSSGTKSVKVGLSGIMPGQELSRQCHLAS